jgi:vacuolar-type H+-ATPase subunit I/STV1
MRINTKDLISGGIILLVALVGLWLNQDHSLGTARRMGPGYMPMLALSLLGALGAVVFVLGLFSGPDPLSAWTRLDVIAVPFGVAAFFIGYFVAGALGSTGWYTLGFALLAGTLALSVSPGWRPLGLVHAGMALFGLMLEPFGLMLSIAVAVAVSSLAEPHHRPKGVLLMILFLCVLCYAVFIYELDIRVPVWPVFLTQ